MIFQPTFATPMGIARPVLPSLDSFRDNFAQAMATGQVTNNGQWVQEFELRLSDYLGVPTLVFSSGQAALMIMVKAAGISGGEVIVPSFTFPGTPHAAVWAGATPVFADIVDDGSFVLDPVDVERKVTDRTVAILSVDPYGIATNYAALDAIGRKHGIKILHDSAPSFGAMVGNRLTGSFGDAQIFSFHATKAFNTMEGGALSSHDPDLIERAKVLRNFGLLPSADSTAIGMNGKMMEICALIGIEQLKTFDGHAATRRASVARMAPGLAALPGITPARAPEGQDPIWAYLPVMVDAARFGCDRDRLESLLAAENLFVRKYYNPPCHQQTCYGPANVGVSLPVTERAAANVLAVPVYNTMTEAECDGVVEAFSRVHGRLRTD